MKNKYWNNSSLEPLDAAAAETLENLTATVTELNYVDQVTGPIQTQIRNKADNIISSYAKPSSPSAITTVDTVAQALGKLEAGVDQVPVLPEAQVAPWKLHTSYTTAGSFTWTAPDLNNGENYEVIVVIDGAGANGRVRIYVRGI